MFWLKVQNKEGLTDTFLVKKEDYKPYSCSIVPDHGIQQYGNKVSKWEQSISQQTMSLLHLVELSNISAPQFFHL